MIRDVKRILFATPPLVGHTSQAMLIAREMVARGFEVTFATGAIFKDQIEGLGAEFCKWEVPLDHPLRAKKEEHERIISSSPNYARNAQRAMDLFLEEYVILFDQADTLFRDRSFDLLVADFLSYPLMDFMQKQGVPVVRYTRYCGTLLRGPTTDPYFPLGLPRNMNWKERLLNSTYPFWLRFHTKGRERRIAKLRKNHLKRKGETHFQGMLPPFTIITSPLGLEIPRAVPQHFYLSGPLLDLPPPPLPMELREWIGDEEESNSPGLILISLGTVIHPDSQQLSAIYEGLSALKNVKILWALGNSNTPHSWKSDDRFRFERKVPQLSVLAHPKLKAFISHGGMNSISEALIFGRPMVIIPFCSDQHYNAARVRDIGIGLGLNKERLTAKDVETAVQAILANPTFRAKALHYSKLQPVADNLQKVGNLLEDIMNNGYLHLCPDTWPLQLYPPQGESESSYHNLGDPQGFPNSQATTLRN